MLADLLTYNALLLYQSSVALSYEYNKYYNLNFILQSLNSS
jgi:hypothetical protein